METSVSQEGSTACYSRIAAPLHTIMVLGAVAAYSLPGKLRASGMESGESFNRVRMYEWTLLFEWLLLAFVLVGVRLHGSSLHTVLGQRWQSVTQFFQDLSIGVFFFIATTLFASMAGPLFGGGTPANVLNVILPQGPLEKFLWIIVSLTAGICEEAIYRGYLQRQFRALSKNVGAGILLSAACFGAVHAYQGWRMVLQIALLGVFLGALAQWRKSTRPGMISHAIQDSLAMVLSGH